MCARPKVTFHNVSKRYTLQQKKLDKILDLLGIKSKSKSFYALKDISFTVDEGETIGVIGINGSGKSTLSNILAQVVPPTTGEIEVNGETSLIAIAVGLNNNLTGLENIELKCLMQGIKKEEIKRITPLIIDFADLGDFINQPVKTFSSGMKSRLGFAISAHTDPDIMVIDEALSVGDQTFYEKCLKKMNEFKSQGKTIFYISHSVSQIRSFCDKTMWIHYGELLEFGPTKEVLKNYSDFIKFFNALSEEEKVKYKKEKMAVRQKEYVVKPISTSRSKKVKKEKTNRKSMELILLVMFFFISTMLMFFDNGVAKGIQFIKQIDMSKDESQVKVEKTSKEAVSDKVEAINKVGYVLTEKESVFQSKELKDEMVTVGFSDQVRVNNKIGDVLEVSVNDQLGYVKEENIYIPQAPFEKIDFNLAGYLDALPASFVGSYQYYLAFINSEQQEIESKIRGKTGEELDEQGNKHLVFGSIRYKLKSDHLSEGIIVNEFDPQKVNMDELIKNAAIISKDNKIFSIFSNDYEYIFNLNNQSVTIIAGE
ncbi:ABC transporter ATP-binding protein [Neobacillus niacini]|uniref:ABC transporter ATP-binding protein n=1 Tax=Neobacillus niacini TaxID=86668 RepID=UPI001C8D93CA|nr:ATP-binding cassette domain-containing protein [Neobacillus niacini]MBY0145139.1 ATP-binding cassette domain-containing protein [Neobacillus niacini]